MENLCKKARGKLGLTQKEFGKITGISSTVIYRRESGELNIPKPAKNLYESMIAIAHGGLSDTLKKALDLIPESERREEVSLVAIGMFLSLMRIIGKDPS